MVAQAFTRNREYSLFSNTDTKGNVEFEVREGDVLETDSTTLGENEYDQATEDFFGTRFLAHVHGPSASPLPSMTDLKMLAHRAALRGDTQDHTVIGFYHGVPVVTHIRVHTPQGSSRPRFEISFSETMPAHLRQTLLDIAEHVRIDAGTLVSNAGSRAAADAEEPDKVVPLLARFTKYLASGKRDQKEERRLQRMIEQERFPSMTIGPPAPRTLEQTIQDILFGYLESLGVRAESLPPALEKSYGFETALENAHARVLVRDIGGALKKNAHLKQLVDTFLEAAQDVRNGATEFRAIINVTDNAVAIQMHPGKHKEAVNVLLSDERVPAVLTYRHIPSSHERDKTERFNYILGVLGTLRDRVFNTGTFVETNRDTKEVRSLMLIPDMSDLLEMFKLYIRLSQSVKDLDLLLQEKDIPFAVEFFDLGVTNMRNYLTYRQQILRAEAQEIKDFKDYLTPAEEELFAEYAERVRQIKDTKRSIRNSLEDVHKAKDLNYEILAELQAIGSQAISILGIDTPSPKVAHDFLSAVERVLRKIGQMTKLSAGAAAHADVPDANNMKSDALETEALSAAVKLAEVARFGYGSPDAVKHEDGSVSISPDPDVMVRIPVMARKAYEKFFEAFFRDPGTELNKWEDVGSIEEGVRFLHAALVRAAYTFSEELVYMFFHSLSAIGDNEQKGAKIATLDLTRHGVEKSETAMLISRTLGRLDSSLIMEKAPRQSVVIFTDNRTELSLRAGKHYVELAAQTHEKSGERTISLRYFESFYDGAFQRQDFVQTVLERLGFKTKSAGYEGRLLQALLVTHDAGNWRHALTEALRLSIAMQNFDLDGIREDSIELFELGAVQHLLFRLFREVREGLRERETGPQLQHGISVIMRVGTAWEKEALLRLLTADMDVFERDYESFLKKLDDNQLDDFLNFLLESEENARREGNKSLARRLVHIGAKIEKMMKVQPPLIP
jgi:hypothetical protein